MFIFVFITLEGGSKKILLQFMSKTLLPMFEMATHSSTLAWRIPWMQKPGGLPSMGSHRVGHD